MRISTCLLAVALCAAFTGSTGAVTLYYGGDPQFPGGYANQENARGPHWAHYTYRVYDDFEVTAPAWHVTSIYNQLGGALPSDTQISSASYEIRTGISNNDLGTLVASGTGPASLSYQGAAPDNFSLFKMQMDFSVPLDLPAGTYWLMLVPNTVDLGQFYLRDSNLGNGIGSPRADQQAFAYSRFYFFPDTPPDGPTLIDADFSFGVLGDVPEPSAFGAIVLSMFLWTCGRSFGCDRRSPLASLRRR
jgi:hypothetical protein